MSITKADFRLNAWRYLMHFQKGDRIYVVFAVKDDDAFVTQLVLAATKMEDGKYEPILTDSVMVELFDNEMSPAQVWSVKANSVFNKYLEGKGDGGEPVNFLEELVEFFMERIRYQNGKLVMV